MNKVLSLPEERELLHRNYIDWLLARRDALLSTPDFDVAAAGELAADFRAAGFLANAEALQRRVEHYQQMQICSSRPMAEK